MQIGDEHFYALVADELESEQLDKGTWTKAIAKNGFDKDRARATYVELRVEQLKKEAKRKEEEAKRKKDKIKP
ncbi:hypothetical protein ACFLRO_00575 [Bacteroidota bacterium]